MERYRIAYFDKDGNASEAIVVAEEGNESLEGIKDLGLLCYVQSLGDSDEKRGDDLAALKEANKAAREVLEGKRDKPPKPKVESAGHVIEPRLKDGDPEATEPEPKLSPVDPKGYDSDEKKRVKEPDLLDGDPKASGPTPDLPKGYVPDAPRDPEVIRPA